MENLNLNELLVQYVSDTASEEEHEQAYDGILDMLADEFPSSEVSEAPHMTMSMSSAEDISYSHSPQQSQKITIQALVSNMQPQLSSDDDQTRHRATLLLAEIFENRTDMVMKPAVIHLFVVFFCNRLQDYPSLTPALQALIALSQHHGHLMKLSKKFSDSDNLDILQALVGADSGIHVQSTAQSIRSKVFTLLEIILEELDVDHILGHQEAAKWLDGIVSTGEGEKDPRCLLQYLRLLRRCTTLFNGVLEYQSSGELQRRLYNAVACYFPITFTPPEDDAFGVTTPMLVNALQDVLISPQLLSLTVSFLYDQLEDGALQVGIQHALHAIIKIVEIYGITQGDILKILPELVVKLYDLAVDTGPESNAETARVAAKELCCAAEKLMYEHKASTKTLHSGSSINNKTNENTENSTVSLALTVWRQVSECLLTRTAVELQRGLAGLKSRHAAQMAFQVAKAGYIGAAATMQRLLPLFRGPLSTTCARLGETLLQIKPNALKVEVVSPTVQQERNATAASLGLVVQLLRCLPDESSENSSGTSVLFPMDVATELTKEVYQALPMITSESYQSDLTNDNSGIDISHKSNISSFILNPDDTIQLATVLQVALELQRRCPGGSTVSQLHKLLLLAADISVYSKLALIGLIENRNIIYSKLYDLEGSNTEDNESVLALRGAARSILLWAAALPARLPTQEESAYDKIIDPYMKEAVAYLSNIAISKTKDIGDSNQSSNYQRSAWESLANMACSCILDSTTELCMTPILEAVSSEDINNASNAMYALETVVGITASGRNDQSKICRATVLLLQPRYVHSVLQGGQMIRNARRAANILTAAACINDSHRSTDSTSVSIVSRSIQEAAALAALSYASETAEKAFTSYSSDSTDAIMNWTIHWNPKEHTILQTIQTSLSMSVPNITAELHHLPDSTLLHIAHESAMVALSIWGSLPTDLSDLGESNELHLYQVIALALYMTVNNTRSSDNSSDTAVNGMLLAAIIHRLPTNSDMLNALVAGYESLYESVSKPETESTVLYDNNALSITSILWGARALCSRTDIKVNTNRIKIKKTLQEELCHYLLCIADGDKGSKAAANILQYIYILCASHVKGWVHATGMNTLWRQRLWYRLQTVLTTNIKNAESKLNHNKKLQYSIALCCIAAHMPSPVIEHLSNDLTRYSVQALALHSNFLANGDKTSGDNTHGTTLLGIPVNVYRSQCLQTLFIVGDINANVLSPHLKTIVPLLLQISSQNTLKSKDRAMSVSILKSIATLAHMTLHPYRVMVLKGLKKVNNDKKRVVRRLAADCGTAWLREQ
jgi:hypothetical protein